MDRGLVASSHFSVTEKTRGTRILREEFLGMAVFGTPHCVGGIHVPSP